MLRPGVGWEQGPEVAKLLQAFSGPLEDWLDWQVDRCLVCAFFLALIALARVRNSRSGLLLSELGVHVLPLAQALAGTGRFSNLLRSLQLPHTLLGEFHGSGICTDMGRGSGICADIDRGPCCLRCLINRQELLQLRCNCVDVIPGKFRL